MKKINNRAGSGIKTLSRKEVVDAEIAGGGGAAALLAYAACNTACHFIFGGKARKSCYAVCQALLVTALATPTP